MRPIVAAPSEHHLTDEWKPTNEALWQDVLELARGDRDELRASDGTIIQSPHFKPWPSPPGSAWATKTYNSLDGGWTRKASLVPFLHDNLSLILPSGQMPFHPGLVKVGEDRAGNVLWSLSLKGRKRVAAAVGDELQRRMHTLLAHFTVEDGAELGEWIEKTFRVGSPKTPRGGKELKKTLEKLVWVLKFRLNGVSLLLKKKMEERDGPTPGLEDYGKHSPDEVEKLRLEVAALWKDVEPFIAQVTRLFTEEGSGTVRPEQIEVGGRTYINAIGETEANLKKYITRLEQIFASLRGWRASVGNNLKVVLGSPKDMDSSRSQLAGKYRSGTDTVYLRATPTILKRADNYGSFEYVLVHELGHRYEFKNKLATDFDTLMWQTTAYSRQEGEAFAELFALGHFKYGGPWSPVVERFEEVMAK